LFLSRSRLPLYVLPLFPALALLVARRLEQWRASRVVLVLLACWLAALVGLRVAAAHYPTDNDSRRLARAIAASALPEPSEVIFVEATPQWGLELYLRCEVERVRLAGKPPAQPGDEDTLESELAGLTTQRPLLIARTDRRREVESELARLGYAWRDLGTLGRWFFLAPAVGPDARPSPAPGSTPR
jgi:hypothetical protein